MTATAVLQPAAALALRYAGVQHKPRHADFDISAGLGCGAVPLVCKDSCRRRPVGAGRKLCGKGSGLALSLDVGPAVHSVAFWGSAS